LRELDGLAECLGVLQLRGLLGGCTPGLVLLEVLARVRLRLGLRCKLLLLVVEALLGMAVLRRLALGLLWALVLLLLVVDLLRLGGSVDLGVREQRAWHVLRVEGLVLAGILRGRDGGLVALVLLLLLLRGLLLRLQTLALALVGEYCDTPPWVR
jgi:hypothetical protein